MTVWRSPQVADVCDVEKTRLPWPMPHFPWPMGPSPACRPQPRCVGRQVVALRNARRFFRSRAVVRNRGVTIAGHFVQMCAYGIEPIVTGEPFVSVERFEQLQPGGGSVYHGGSDRVVEGDHRVVRHALEETVERQDLRP